MSRKLHEDKLIVVTGGAGFIGSGVVRALNDLGHTQIVVVDDLGMDAKWLNLRTKRFVEIISIDGCFDWLHGREEDIQAFIHLGACSDTTEADADYLLENNTRYSIGLAEYALQHGHRFIYASSAATYGDGSKGFSDDHAVIDSLEPLNLYGYSKQLFDQWAVRQGVLDQLVGLKYFNVFGPNELHKERMASVIVKMVPQVLQGEGIRLFKSSDPAQFADGEQKRDFIYVKDAVRMTLAFLFNDLGGIFNIGTGQAQSWNDLARGVFKALEVVEKITYIDMPKDLVGKYQNFTQADMSKYTSHKELPFQLTPLEEAVSDYVRNYLVPGKHW